MRRFVHVMYISIFGTSINNPSIRLAVRLTRTSDGTLSCDHATSLLVHRLAGSIQVKMWPVAPSTLIVGNRHLYAIDRDVCMSIIQKRNLFCPQFILKKIVFAEFSEQLELWFLCFLGLSNAKCMLLLMIRLFERNWRGEKLFFGGSGTRRARAHKRGFVWFLWLIRWSSLQQNPTKQGEMLYYKYKQHEGLLCIYHG